MAQVKATVTPGTSFNYKGEQYVAGDEISFKSPGHAAKYEKLGFVKFDRETAHKVEDAVEKIKEKNEKAGPNAPKK
jgi:hypothetical protein